MKLLDVLFLPYILIWMPKWNTMCILCTGLVFMSLHLFIFYKYKVARERSNIVISMFIGNIFFIIAVMDAKDGMTGIFLLFGSLFVIFYLLAILIYFYSFILKPLFNKNKQ